MDLSRELADAVWVKSSLSGPDGGDCLYVARLSGGRVALRDSEAPDQPPFVVRQEVWSAFADGIRTGEFEFLTHS